MNRTKYKKYLDEPISLVIIHKISISVIASRLIIFKISELGKRISKIAAEITTTTKTTKT